MVAVFFFNVHVEYFPNNKLKMYRIEKSKTFCRDSHVYIFSARKLSTCRLVRKRGHQKSKMIFYKLCIHLEGLLMHFYRRHSHRFIYCEGQFFFYIYTQTMSQLHQMFSLFSRSTPKIVMNLKIIVLSLENRVIKRCSILECIYALYISSQFLPPPVPSRTENVFNVMCLNILALLMLYLYVFV